MFAFLRMYLVAWLTTPKATRWNTHVVEWFPNSARYPGAIRLSILASMAREERASRPHVREGDVCRCGYAVVASVDAHVRAKTAKRDVAGRFVTC